MIFFEALDDALLELIKGMQGIVTNLQSTRVRVMGRIRVRVHFQARMQRLQHTV